ncbi:MAG: hypothetical protein ACO1G6_10980 [Bacteroidota bacterium]
MHPIEAGGFIIHLLLKNVQFIEPYLFKTLVSSHTKFAGSIFPSCVGSGD